MPSAPVGHADFLSELNESDSLAALRSAHSEKSVLVFTVGSPPKPVKTFIDNFNDKRAILNSELKEHALPADREISFKFHVGTETYFIKTFIKSHMNRYYFDMSSKVLQLKRRREPRYLVPKKWNQTAAIQLQNYRLPDLSCTVLDISLSGIRFEIHAGQKIPGFVRDDIISLKYQIYKRGEITATAIVRFLLVKPNMPTIIGLEYGNISEVQSKRVASLIDDIILFASTNKK